MLLAFLAPLGLLLRAAAEQRAVATASAAQSTAALLALRRTAHLAAAPTEDRLPSSYAGPARRRGRAVPSVALARARTGVRRPGRGGVEVLVPVQSAQPRHRVVRVFAPDGLLHAGVLRNWGTRPARRGVAALGLLFADRLGRRLVAR